MRRWVGALSLALLAGGPGPATGLAAAYELQHLSVSRQDQRYHLQLQVRLQAPAAAAYAVFTDARLLPRINPSLREAEILELTPGTTGERLRTRVRLCAGPFCRQIDQVQHMRYRTGDDGYGIQADVIPALSDLRFGQARWHFMDCAGNTCLDFDARIEPAFWVPPLIGPWLIEKTLREQAMTTSAGIERLARAHAGLPALP